MPIVFPGYQELIGRIRSDLRGKLPNIDPTIFGSIVRAFADSMASRVFDAYLLEEQLLKQFFPQTAERVYLEMHGEPFGIIRNPATKSIGTTLFTGNDGASVLSGTVVKLGSVEYETQEGVILSPLTSSVQSLTRSGNTVTALSSGHSFSSGVSVTVSGVDQPEYNGSFEVSVVNSGEFTYQVTGSPSTPATGTITASVIGATAQIVSSSAETIDVSVNANSGATLTLSTPLPGVETDTFVGPAGITGGTVVESDTDYRARVIERIGNPVSNFNQSQITQRAKQITGVTRVWVFPITPAVGSVTVYFSRDNDDNIFPDANELTEVKNSILLDLPATSDGESVFVLSPTPVVQNFTFASISPDTPTMRASIRDSLSAFFEDKTNLQTDITQDQYRSAIQETQDTSTGDFLGSFVLSSPVGTITVGTGSLATIGVVNYA